MAPADPDRHQPDADLWLFKPQTLSTLGRRRQLLRKSAADGRGGWSRLGFQLEHGPAKIHGQLHAVCRALRGHAGYVSGGVGQVQMTEDEQCGFPERLELVGEAPIQGYGRNGSVRPGCMSDQEEPH